MSQGMHSWVAGDSTSRRDAGPPSRVGQRLLRHHRPQEEAGEVAAAGPSPRRPAAATARASLPRAFRGGGHKRMYRLIDFKRQQGRRAGQRSSAIEYDPNRTSRIALIQYEDGEKTYILAPEGLKAGRPGDSKHGEEGWSRASATACRLKAIPLGMSIPQHRDAARPRRPKLCRSARHLQPPRCRPATPSGRRSRCRPARVRRVSSDCRGDARHDRQRRAHKDISLGKAGRKRWMGRKPHNRGTSQNPVSHPMGGGEGRTAGGRHPCSPTGVLAKGGKTRKKRKPSNAADHLRRRRPGPLP